MSKPSDNTILTEEQFIKKYISFIKALKEAEDDLEDDKYRISDPKVRLDLFQFFFVDGRNQQDMARIDEDVRKEEAEEDDDDDHHHHKEPADWWDPDKD